MNNLQVAKVVHEAVCALDTSSGTADSKRWEDLTEDERNKAASDANALSSNLYHGATPAATSDGFSTNDERLKDLVREGIVNAFNTREQELAAGPNQQEKTVQEALDKADKDLADHNATGAQSEAK